MLTAKTHAIAAAHAFMLVLGAVVLWNQMAGFRDDHSGLIEVGSSLPAVEGLALPSGTPALLIVFRTGCTYAERSIPFYQRLLDRHRRGGLRATPLLVSPDSEDTLRAVRSIHGLDLRGIGGVPLQSLHVRATPTLLLVDGDRTVRRVWEGWLDPDAEKRVLMDLGAEDATGPLAGDAAVSISRPLTEGGE